MTDEEFRAIIAAGPAVVMVESRHMISLLDERDGLKAEVERLGEALVYIGNVCIRHDRGDETGRALGHIADHARAALEVKP
jgi:hypothetical protein